MRLLMQDILRAAKGYATQAVAPFTVGGKLNLGTGNAIGSVPIAGGGTGTDQGAEPPLGNPASDGDILTSTMAGVRSWSGAGDLVQHAGRWEPVMNGSVEFPELVYAAGQPVYVWVEGPLP